MTAMQEIRRTIKTNYLQPAFLVCVGVLAVSAGTMSMAIKLSGMYLKKEPLPPKNPLSRMDTSKLAPYKAVNKQEISNQDILESLGTEDYIQWTLEDKSVPADSATRFCSLFITYYELPDQVPHVPEICYTGSGFQQKSSELIALNINRNNNRQQITVRHLEFTGSTNDALAGASNFPVFYIFSVNGEYATGRQDTRLILNKNMFGKYSYFSKVEWKFYNIKFGSSTYPDKQEASAASEKLLGANLPILEKDHWPSGLW
jgi:hypothetical protein